MHLSKVSLLIAASFSFFLFSPLSFSENLNKNSHTSMMFKVMHDQFILDHAIIQKASLIKDKTGNFEGLEIILKPSAAKDFNILTAKNIGNPMSLVFNKKVISTAIIQSSLGANFQIIGITQQEAQAFLDSLK